MRGEYLEYWPMRGEYYLCPVGGGAPYYCGQAPVLLDLASLDGLGALLCVPVLVVTHVTLQTAHCKGVP